MKIYTQTGDQGETSLLSGERVAKNHVRVKTYGDVDELNAIIGAVVAALPEAMGQVTATLQAIQNELFQLGGWLAATPGSKSLNRLKPISSDHVRRLENLIDDMTAVLPEFRTFILPGGHMAAAMAHIARAVCRRVERSMLDLRAAEKLAADGDDLAALAYVNRLSDLFFVLARFINHKSGAGDVVWRG